MTLVETSGASRGRAVGAAVGTLFGAGWWTYGLRPGAAPVRVVLGALGLMVAVTLLALARRLVFTPRAATRGVVRQPRSRRTVLAFAALVVVEVLLLNLVILALSPPALHVWWPLAISVVVGLHFLPMARIFQRPELTACGLAMLAAALVAGVGFALGADRVLVGSLESLANGAILWVTTARNLRLAAARAG